MQNFQNIIQFLIYLNPALPTTRPCKFQLLYKLKRKENLFVQVIISSQLKGYKVIFRLCVETWQIAYFHCNTLIHSKFHSELSHTIQNTWCAPRDHTQQDNQHWCVMNGLIRPILDQTLEQILCTFNWAYFPFMMNYQKVHSPLPTFIHCPF